MDASPLRSFVVVNAELLPENSLGLVSGVGIVGRVVFGEEWLLVGEALLPMTANGETVLREIPNAKLFQVSNHELRSDKPGLNYRSSPSPDAERLGGHLARYGSSVGGIPHDDAYVRVGELFLPTHVRGCRVLVACEDLGSNDEEEDNELVRESLSELRAEVFHAGAQAFLHACRSYKAMRGITKADPQVEEQSPVSGGWSARWSKLKSGISGAVLRGATSFGIQRELGHALDPEALCFYNVKLQPGVAGLVALTLDDAPGRQGPEQSLLEEVSNVLAEYDAKATLFLCTGDVPWHEPALVSLLRQGHEVGNHGAEDRSYAADSEADFEASLQTAENACNMLRAAAGQARSGDEPSWFRAPHADVSPTMRRVLDRHRFTNVLADCFANDTLVTDAHTVSESLLRMVCPAGGSIICLHTPERGFREHNLESLRLLLAGLQRMNLRATTLTELHRAAGETSLSTSASMPAPALPTLLGRPAPDAKPLQSAPERDFYVSIV